MADKRIRQASNESQKAIKKLAQAGKELKARVAEMDARERKRQELENLPLEVILRARELSLKNKFRRSIVKATPKNFDTDAVELDCGHTTSTFFRSDDPTRECRECLEAWLRRNGRRARRGTE
jgi:hypothetical protein